MKMSSTVFCWGHAGEGQLGLRVPDNNVILLPQEVTSVNKWHIKDVQCGDKHTVIVLKDGTVYTCGNNDHGQLGHDKSRKRPEQVNSLEALVITQVAAGAAHNLAVNSAGEIYSWGDNSHGQLGRGPLDGDSNRVPKLVKGLVGQTIVQVCCGENHSLALTDDGQVLCWGRNNYGQLGVGNNTGQQDMPQSLACLRGIPVGMIAAGGNHSLMLSLSGALFGWGRNSFGQLGVNDEKDRYYPTLCKAFRSQKVAYVACGDNHTAALTKEGGVFTFGAGMYGQLGHSSQNTEILPRKVLELMGSTVSQLACGRCHTLAFVPASGKVYSFGLGGNGQLGQGDTTSQTSPFPVKGPFIPSCQNGTPMQTDNSSYVIEKIACGGDQCFCLVSEAKKPDIVCEDFRCLKSECRILRLSEELVDRICELNPDEQPSQHIYEQTERIFGSQSCLNSSFLKSNDNHYSTNSKNHGIDIECARVNFQKLGEARNKTLTQLIVDRLESKLIQEVCQQQPPDIEAMRIYLVLSQTHLFDQPKYYKTVICPIGHAIFNLDKPASKILDLWWASLPSGYFSRLVYTYKQTVVFILHLTIPRDEQDVLLRQYNLYTGMEVLQKLNTVNEQAGQIIPYHRFYISELKDKVDIKADYINWVQNADSHGYKRLLSFCNYAFVFDGPAKTMLLQTDAIMQMQSAIDEVYRRNLTSLFLPIDRASPCLVLCVSRTNLVQDTILQLTKQGNADFKKPLKVLFLGEEAIDAGGVRKEFFLLILREVLDPKYGMFKYHEESRLLWFNPQSFEEESMFQLIGVLCGLAIYNSTIIDMHFPQALYKKLLERPVILDDVKELMPSVGRSLVSLLEYEGSDVAEVFDLTFQLTEDHFGELKSVDLVPDGAFISVNNDNSKDYVEAYIGYIFNKSVEAKFNSFNEGFHKVCGGRVLGLFHPKELEAMIVGNENYDFHELEKNTEYKGEYHRYHPTIKFFWEVFHDLSLEEKKKFLLFLTGSDRIPILGMKAVRLVIQLVCGGEDFLPVAHTCFNLLDLPKYTTKQRLHQKLVHAIDNCQGFGLV